MPLTRIAWPDDEAYDRTRASNGESRYGAYLRQATESFHESGEALEPVEFAAQCWRQATGPVMSPGYIEFANRIMGVRLERDDWDGALLAILSFPLRWPRELNRYRPPMDGWQDWETERQWSDSEAGEDDAYRFIEPRIEGKPALMLTGTIVVPIPLDTLPERRNPAPWQRNRRGARVYVPGEVDVQDAKRTVKRICDVLDLVALPQLNAAIGG